jgi:peroxiredoxin
VDGGQPPLAVTHPFHIHTNPFLVTRVTSLVEPGQVGVPVDVTFREIGSSTWRDTLALQQGYTYELLTRYEDFTGSFVQHCHILDHEDQGMMELVRIDLPTSSVGPARGSIMTGEEFLTKLVKARNSPQVLLFVRGSVCPHCMEQLKVFSETMKAGEATVTVVSSTGIEDVKDFPDMPFELVADPSWKVFRHFGVVDDKHSHGTVVLNAKGKTLLRELGETPFMDVKVVTAALAQDQPQGE